MIYTNFIAFYTVPCNTVEYDTVLFNVLGPDSLNTDPDPALQENPDPGF
jgi:hypothetical protein